LKLLFFGDAVQHKLIESYGRFIYTVAWWKNKEGAI